MSKNQEQDFNSQTDEDRITLSLDHGDELDCRIVTILEAGGRDYIVLYPLDESFQSEEGEVFIYRYSETESGEPDLQNIEDDEEFEIVSDAFDEYLDSCEYDELVDSDEE